MNETQWDTLAILFEQALSMPAAERVQFLDKACGDDEALRRELDSLLESFNAAPPFFDSLGDVVAVPAKADVDKAEVPDTHNLIGAQIGRYKVTELLGGGGMGVVYKAEDIELHRTVALKFLPPALSFDEQARERFMAEARAASGLDHVNVCTVHEIGRTKEGAMFIAMAHYEGETLKQKIAENAIPAELAIEYTLQIGSGLSKAHAKRIIHRDVKPANLMVTREGDVKILDFGLAKIAEQQLTQTGARMGTVAYMSPEQVKGDAIDHRTDIWSLGVVLYEMVIGKKPFGGGNPQTAIHGILNLEPAPMSSSDRRVAPYLASIISKCLEKDPVNRYESVDALIEDLREKRPTQRRSKTVSKNPRRFYQVAGGVVLFVALLLLLPFTRDALFNAINPAGPASNEMRIAFMPVISLPEGDEANEAIAAGLGYSMTGLLNDISKYAEKELWIVPASEMSVYGIKTVNEAAEIFGVNLVLKGIFRSLNDVVVLTMELIDSEQSHLVGTETRLIDSAEITEKNLSLGFQEQILESLAALLGIPLNDRMRNLVQASLPDNSDAYAFYLQGVGYLQRLDQPGHIDLAIQLFDQSLKEDSLFALAHAGRCEAVWEKYIHTSNMALAPEALTSCNRATVLAQDVASVLVHVASVFLRTGEHGRAEETLNRALEIEPDNADAFRWLGRTYEDQGQTDQAVEAYQQAITYKPNVWIYEYDLGILLEYAGRHEEARTHLERGSRLTPDNYYMTNVLGYSYLQTNELDAAQTYFESSLQTHPNVYAYRGLGDLHLRNNQYAEALVALRLARTANENDWWTWRLMGHAYHWQNQQDSATVSFNRAIALIEPTLDINPDDFDVLGGLAEMYAVLGDSSISRDYLNKLGQLNWSWNYITFYLGRTYEMLGDRASAFKYIEEALQNGYAFNLVVQDPWLGGFRADERYQALSEHFSDE